MVAIFLSHVVIKVGYCQKILENFYISQKIFQKTILNYPKLLHPVHGNDKVFLQFNKLHVEKYYSYEIKIQNRIIACSLCMYKMF